MSEKDPLGAFRRDARAWLDANARPRDQGESVADSESVAVFRDETEAEEARSVADACAWHGTKLASGWALLTWPKQLGGQELSGAHERAFDEEERRFDIPYVPEALTITLKLVAPTMTVFGTADQQAHLLPQLLRADALCCQLFSEPDAGSDLASLACRATRDGDGWRIDGQKIWTSGARQCTFGLLIARSDAAARKRRGLTAFLLPMNTPGVEVRPIRQMTGGASFNEVFLEGAQVSDALRLGAVGDGWKVTTTMLGFERSVSGAGAGGAGASWEQVKTLAARTSPRDPVARQELAALFTRMTVLDYINQRSRDALAVGQDPGASGSIAKLFWTQNLSEISRAASHLLGAKIIGDAGEPGTYSWTEHLLGAPGYRIAGGSDEIQRNIIGERVLGLPREPTTSPTDESRQR